MGNNQDLKQMTREKTILAIIPARGGSKRIPRKNIKLLHGKPLIQYTINAAEKSKLIDRIVVSTEDNEIRGIVRTFGVEVLQRPKTLAQDWSKTIDVILDAVKKVECDIVVCLQPTSPLRITEDVDNAIELFLKGRCESVISVFEAEENHTWLMKMKEEYLVPIFGNKYFSSRSQDLPKMFIPNGAIFIASKKILEKYKSFYTKKILPYVMPLSRSLDIDSENDFLKAEESLNK